MVSVVQHWKVFVHNFSVGIIILVLRNSQVLMCLILCLLILSSNRRRSRISQNVDRASNGDAAVCVGYAAGHPILGANRANDGKIKFNWSVRILR